MIFGLRQLGELGFVGKSDLKDWTLLIKLY